MTFEQLHTGLTAEAKAIADIQERYQEGLITSVECMFATLACTQNATSFLQSILNLAKAEAAKSM